MYLIFVLLLILGLNLGEGAGWGLISEILAFRTQILDIFLFFRRRKRKFFEY